LSYDFPDYWGVSTEQGTIYPNAEPDEIIKKARKKYRYMKQYNKGDFVYMVQKPPFQEQTIAALHKPTGIMFGWDSVFLGWEKLPYTWDEYMRK